MVLGYRKLIVVVILAAAATFAPDMDAERAKVLIALGTTFLGANAVVHMAKGVGDALSVRSGGDSHAGSDSPRVSEAAGPEEE